MSVCKDIRTLLCLHLPRGLVRDTGMAEKWLKIKSGYWRGRKLLQKKMKTFIALYTTWTNLKKHLSASLKATRQAANAVQEFANEQRDRYDHFLTCTQTAVTEYGRNHHWMCYDQIMCEAQTELQKYVIISENVELRTTSYPMLWWKWRYMASFQGLINNNMHTSHNQLQLRHQHIFL